jgi:hypothetical protein
LSFWFLIAVGQKPAPALRAMFLSSLAELTGMDLGETGRAVRVPTTD